MMDGQADTVNAAFHTEQIRRGYSPSLLPGAIRVLDVAALTLAYVTQAYLLDRPVAAETDHRIFFVLVFLTGFFMLAGRARLYETSVIMRPLSRLDDMMIVVATTLSFLFSMILLLKLGDAFDIVAMASFGVIGFAAVGAARLIVKPILMDLSRRGVIGSAMVVLGVGEQAARFLRRFERAPPFFVHIVGVFSPEEAPTAAPAALEGAPCLGDLSALMSYARNQKVDDVVVAIPWNNDRKATAVVERLKELPVNVYLSTDLVGFELTFRPAVSTFSSLPMFEVVQRPMSGWSSALKTMLDYLVASVVLLALSPLFLLLALAIRLDSPGPIFFMQKRLGFNNEEFSIYKFRSMYHDRPGEERIVRQATRGDPRVTRVGRIIRATSLDELPQLFNVLNGTMSLVGPRPHAVSHNEEYGRQIRGYFARHKVKPGITGWAQVNGLRGETTTIDKMERRIQHDIYYAENWSLFLDLRILIKTVVVVLFQKTAY